MKMDYITIHGKQYPVSDFRFPKKPKTNAERIRAMSDRDFAEWLDAISKACYDEGYTKETDEPLMSPYPCTASQWLDWLKQEAE